MFIQQRPARTELLPQATTAGLNTLCFTSVACQHV